MIAWQYYPESDSLANHLGLVVRAFAVQEPEIRSIIGSDESDLSSDRVLAAVGTELLQLGYRVETSRSSVSRLQKSHMNG